MEYLVPEEWSIDVAAAGERGKLRWAFVGMRGFE